MNENIISNKEKKQIPLRINQGLCNDLTAWAEDEFRSLNGQIEFLLTECVRRRKKGSGINGSGINGGGIYGGGINGGDNDDVEHSAHRKKT